MPMNVRRIPVPVLNMVQMPAASIPMEAMSVAVHEAIELKVMVLSVKVSQRVIIMGGSNQLPT